MKKQVFLTMLLLILASALIARPALGGSTVYLGPHRIEFVSVQYDNPQLGRSKWTYRVASGNPGITEWILALNGFASTNIKGTSESWQWQTGPITGIRFTKAYAAGEARNVWFILDGNYPSGEQAVGVWTATSYWSGPTITGPSAAVPATATATWTPTATATATATVTWTPTAIATDTATPTSTWTPTPIATATATATWTPTSVATGTATATPTGTSTPTTTPTMMPTRPFTCTIGPHTLTIVRVDYNFPRSGQSRWTYRISPGGNVEEMIFGIESVGGANVASASRPWAWSTGPLVGLKIFGPITTPEEIWFDLKGYWDTNTIPVAFWSDSRFHSGYCQGPVTSPPSPE